MKRTELKVIVLEALENEYGFYPKLKDIVLIDYNDDGTFIHFNVNGIPYCCYKGTITKEQ